MKRVAKLFGIAALLTGQACSSSPVKPVDAGDTGDGEVGSAACGCGGGFAVDIQGDGDSLHLTSGDYTGADWRSDLGSYANLLSTDINNRPTVVQTECLSTATPWAESTTGEVSLVYWVQACAGPDSAPPCVWLKGNSAPGFFTSLYIDRAGRAFRASITTMTTSFQPFQTPLSSTIDGQFTLEIQDGEMTDAGAPTTRTLSGTLRVCVLASVNFV
jgi:hypothetical protein